MEGNITYNFYCEDHRGNANHEGHRWEFEDAPMIKEFTGGDPITCRFLYKESFTYIPKFKLIMAVNDRPNLSQKDSAIW